MGRTQYIFIDSENVHEKDLSRVADKTAIVNLVLGARQQPTWNGIDDQIEKLGEKGGLTRTPSAKKKCPRLCPRRRTRHAGGERP